jgi:two-component system invasion response regulator UvrY
MINILIADDHVIVREGLKQILHNIPDIKVCGETGTGDDALKLIRAGDWGVLLLDIAMPGKNVLDVIKRAKHYAPHVAILILSMYSEDQYAVRTLRAGADGYLTKDAAPDKLVEAIRTVANGRKYISTSMLEKLIVELHVAADKPLHTTLSDREFQVFLALGTGKGLSEIAVDMALSVKTISTYRTRIMTKMKMTNNAEVIHYVLEANLLEQAVQP